MTGRHSYRALLTRRFALLWALSLSAIGLLLHVAVRTILIQQVDTSLSLIASLQASAIAQSPPDSMIMQEWELDQEQAMRLKDILWYMQVRDQEGRVVLRSKNLRFDLPALPEEMSSIRGGAIAFRSVKTQDRHFREVFYPLQQIDPRHRGHIVQAAVSLGPLHHTLYRIDLALTAVGLLGLLLVTMLGWSISSRAIRPVSGIVRQVRAFQTAGEENRITAFAETVEFADLVRVLNEMLERLRRSFEAQERFTADASHELRSPLTAMRGELEVALRKPRDAESYRTTLRSSLEEVGRMQALVGDLLILARRDAGALQPRVEEVRLSGLIAEVERMLGPTASRKQIDIATDVPAGIVIPADRNMLERVLINLLDNAIRYAPAGSTVTVQAIQDEERVEIGVTDEGEGILLEDRERIFERFFRAETARTAGEGVGLGLALTRAIVEAHGGTIRAESTATGGAHFVVALPSSREPEEERWFSEHSDAGGVR